MALSKYLGYELGRAMLCWQKLCPARPCLIHPPRRRLMITVVAYVDIIWRKSHIEIIDIVLVAVIIKILRSESEESPRRPFDDTAGRRAVRPSSMEFRPTAASTRFSSAKGYTILWVPISNNNNIWARSVFRWRQ